MDAYLSLYPHKLEYENMDYLITDEHGQVKKLIEE